MAEIVISVKKFSGKNVYYFDTTKSGEFDQEWNMIIRKAIQDVLIQSYTCSTGDTKPRYNENQSCIKRWNCAQFSLFGFPSIVH